MNANDIFTIYPVKHTTYALSQESQKSVVNGLTVFHVRYNEFVNQENTYTLLAYAGNNELSIHVGSDDNGMAIRAHDANTLDTYELTKQQHYQIARLIQQSGESDMALNY